MNDQFAAKVFARAVLQCAAAYENSFDHEASNAAQMLADKEREADPTNQYAGLVDHSQFYTMSLRQACERTTSSALVDPVYLLLETSWNDAIAWANRTANS